MALQWKLQFEKGKVGKIECIDKWKTDSYDSALSAWLGDQVAYNCSNVVTLDGPSMKLTV